MSLRIKDEDRHAALCCGTPFCTPSWVGVASGSENNTTLDTAMIGMFVPHFADCLSLPADYARNRSRSRALL